MLETIICKNRYQKMITFCGSTFNFYNKTILTSLLANMITSAGLWHWPQPNHAACLTVLACSWWRDNKKHTITCMLSVNTQPLAELVSQTNPQRPHPYNFCYMRVSRQHKMLKTKITN